MLMEIIIAILCSYAWIQVIRLISYHKYASFFKDVDEYNKFFDIFEINKSWMPSKNNLYGFDLNFSDRLNYLSELKFVLEYMAYQHVTLIALIEEVTMEGFDKSKRLNHINEGSSRQVSLLAGKHGVDYFNYYIKECILNHED